MPINTIHGQALRQGIYIYIKIMPINTIFGQVLTQDMDFKIMPINTIHGRQVLAQGIDIKVMPITQKQTYFIITVNYFSCDMCTLSASF